MKYLTLITKQNVASVYGSVSGVDVPNVTLNSDGISYTNNDECIIAYTFTWYDKFIEIDEGIKNGKYVLIPKPNGMNIVGKLRNVNEDASKFYSILKHLSAEGIKDLETLNLSKYFSYPKPINLLTELILGATFFTKKSNDIILDFFSGSATTGHAVFKQNAIDKGNRKVDRNVENP